MYHLEMNALISAVKKVHFSNDVVVAVVVVDDEDDAIVDNTNVD
jgi:hypothetical protein